MLGPSSGNFSLPPFAGEGARRAEGGIKSPSGVVTGFRRDVACNVSKTKNRIAPRNVVLTQNAKKQAAPARRAEARPTPAKRDKYWARQAA